MQEQTSSGENAAFMTAVVGSNSIWESRVRKMHAIMLGNEQKRIRSIYGVNADVSDIKKFPSIHAMHMYSWEFNEYEDEPAFLSMLEGIMKDLGV